MQGFATNSDSEKSDFNTWKSESSNASQKKIQNDFEPENSDNLLLNKSLKFTSDEDKVDFLNVSRVNQQLERQLTELKIEHETTIKNRNSEVSVLQEKLIEKIRKIDDLEKMLSDKKTIAQTNEEDSGTNDSDEQAQMQKPEYVEEVL